MTANALAQITPRACSKVSAMVQATVLCHAFLPQDAEAVMWKLLPYVAWSAVVVCVLF